MARTYYIRVTKFAKLQLLTLLCMRSWAEGGDGARAASACGVEEQALILVDVSSCRTRRKASDAFTVCACVRVTLNM